MNQPRFLWTSVSSTVRRRICTICTRDATFPCVIYFLNRIYQKPVPRLFLPPQVVRVVPEPETGCRALFPFVLASAERRFPVGLCIWGAHPNLCLVWPLGCHAQVSANGPLVSETISHFLSHCSSLKVKTKNERSAGRGPRLHRPGWKVVLCFQPNPAGRAVGAALRRLLCEEPEKWQRPAVPGLVRRPAADSWEAAARGGPCGQQSESGGSF